MEPLDYFLMILVILRIAVGIKLSFIAVKRKRKNQWLNATVFYLNVMAAFFSTSFLTNLFMFRILLGIAQLFNILFTEFTFYMRRKSPVKIILGIWSMLFLSITILDIFHSFREMAELNFIIRMLFATEGLIGWLWFEYACIRAYSTVKSNKIVDDWIKKRMIFIIIYGFCLNISWVCFYFITRSQINIFSVLNIIFVSISIIFQFLSWVMPEFMKDYLNRHFSPPKTDSDLWPSLTDPNFSFRSEWGGN